MTKIVFLVGEDWYFVSHRLALGEACRALGWDVVVATHVTGPASDVIRRAGLTVEPLPLERGGLNPWREIATVRAIARVFRRHAPDLVHAVALKPVLLGGVAALFAGNPPRISALAGMGLAFGGGSWTRDLLRAIILPVLRGLMRVGRNEIIVQNLDDYRLLADNHIAPAARITLIAGSGIDLEHFVPSPEPPSPPIIFALVGRMLKDKGVLDAVAATRILTGRGMAIRLILAGAPDPENHASLTEAELRAVQESGSIEWRGHVEDVAALWREAHVAILPSYYREGLPKSLLEAAGAGRPIITTDSVGCREVVEDGVSGLLVPPKDPPALADAMARLAADFDLRLGMGRAARDRAERMFGLDHVVATHLALYRKLLDQSGITKR